MKANGSKEKLNPNSVIGFTDTETVKLDFDNTPFKQVKYWAFRALEWFDLEGFMILKSSQNNYHLLFNRTVSWKENVRVMAWISLLSHNLKLVRWLIMQCIKEGSTLRISSKNNKASPRIVFRYGKQDDEIKNFLYYRRLVKNSLRKIQTSARTPWRSII